MSGHGGEAEPIYAVEVFKNKSSRLWGILFLGILLPFLAVPWIQEQAIAQLHEADAEGGGGHH